MMSPAKLFNSWRNRLFNARVQPWEELDKDTYGKPSLESGVEKDKIISLETVRIILDLNRLSVAVINLISIRDLTTIDGKNT